MIKNVNETSSERRRESKKLIRNHADEKKRFTPSSRDEWAEVLATADRYY